ncbi:ANTAR domain-containing response regulator [Amycolatopsis sp. H20-H5]|uniref:ANTAR domain-containing response regulator n=1 Tax=Amycolatopsis sp. H20-H5 TaxID=3046309 RepID=UPI002DB6A521|nr:GAF and ANTAR domain-containing protein [Amycolatopsis sp. H20-H5]MEC3982514.1 GAF and ANTAR domain-containing protein [Amycolatopsis sp. H20-H5]
MTDRLEQWAEQLDEVTGALEALASTLSREQDLDAILQAVCEQVIKAVPGADMASVTLSRKDGAETAASTDPRVVRLDTEQYRIGDGPCLRAMATGEVVRVAVETSARLWPEFTASARELGIRSYLAAPLTIDPGVSGALNLFGFQEHGFHELDAKFLDLYRVLAEAIVRSTRSRLQAQEQVEQLRRAMESRSVIEQAKGILMAARGLTAEQAFDVLVARSQRDNVKLREVALQFVASASRIGGRPGR